MGDYMPGISKLSRKALEILADEGLKTVVMRNKRITKLEKVAEAAREVSETYTGVMNPKFLSALSRNDKALADLDKEKSG